MGAHNMRAGGYFTDPFTDLLFNALLGITFLFFITIMFMNPVAKKGNVELKAEYMITVNWPDQRPDDVDIWVQDPRGEILSYLKKDTGSLHLDRDDQGNVTDTVIIDGKEVVYPVNQEIVTLRGLIAGEYIVNLYYYENRSQLPVDITLKVEKVNPSLSVKFYDTITLEDQDVEKTALRFTLGGDGEFIGFNRNPRMLTPYQLEYKG